MIQTMIELFLKITIGFILLFILSLEVYGFMRFVKLLIKEWRK
jgi:hypothetical protein